MEPEAFAGMVLLMFACLLLVVGLAYLVRAVMVKAGMEVEDG